MLARWLLFVASFSPLFALVSLRLQPGGLRDATVIAAALGPIMLALVLLAVRAVEPRTRVLRSVDDRSGDVAGYLATYLLPFLVVSEPTTRDVAAFLGFLLLVGVVYVRSPLVAVNPLAFLAGYRLFSVEARSGSRFMVLAREIVVPDRSVRMRRLLPGLMMVLQSDQSVETAEEE